MENTPKPFDPKNNLKDALVSFNIQLEFNLKSLQEKYDNLKELEERLASTPAPMAALDDEEPQQDLSGLYEHANKLWNKHKELVEKIAL